MTSGNNSMTIGKRKLRKQRSFLFVSLSTCSDSILFFTGAAISSFLVVAVQFSFTEAVGESYVDHPAVSSFFEAGINMTVFRRCLEFLRIEYVSYVQS